MEAIRATGIDGCNILVFDGEAFSKSVAKCAKYLHETSPELAIKYLESMNGISIGMENCTASYDNSDKGC
jgi:hypothetical protein